MRKRARERQGIEAISTPSSSTSKQPLQGSSETRYEIVIRNGACVSVPITEERNTVQFTQSGHVNFFANLEDGQQVEGVANKEHELEKKKEQEDYEKQIGLLTYLGQGSRESTGESAWYEKPSLIKTLQQQPPEEINHKSEKAKSMFDPLRVIRHYIGKPEISQPTKKSISNQKSGQLAIEASPSKSKKKHKRKEKKKRKSSKRSRHSSDSEDSSRRPKKRSRKDSSSSSSTSSSSEDEKKKRLQILRAKRLEREKAERARTNKLLATVHGLPPPREEKESDEDKVVKVQPKVQKYHSQYNPEVAKQNQPLDPNTKYWLQ